MPPPSMSTRTLSAGTNKMSISCGYLHRAGLRPRRRLQLVQQRQLHLLQQPRLHLQQQLQLQLRLQLRLQLLPQPLLRPHQRQQLLLLPDRRRRRDLRRRRDRAPRHHPGRSYGALSPCWHLAAPRQSEAATRKISQRVRCSNFQISVWSDLSKSVAARSTAVATALWSRLPSIKTALRMDRPQAGGYRGS